MKNAGIYKITSPSGKIYIGQSWNISSRKNQYKALNCKSQIHLYRSILKYGWENHQFSILCILYCPTQDLLDDQECFFWKFYKKLGCTLLNIRYPGKGGKMSEASKLKISIAQKGRVRSLEQRKKASLATIGIPHSTTHVEKFKIPILQYDLHDNFIKEWVCAKDTIAFLNIKDSTSITQCCKGKQKTAYGFKWKYKDDAKQKTKYKRT